MKKEINVLSFGAGVQSTALLLLYFNGKLDIKFDHIIFANVGFEHPDIMKHLSVMQSIATQNDHVIHIANYKNLAEDLDSYLVGYKDRVAQIPFFTKDEAGNKGMLTRQCTKDYKIDQVTIFISLKA